MYQRSAAFVKIKKKLWGGGGQFGGGGGWGGQGRCERRIEFFVKIQKKIYFFFGGGVLRGGEVRLGDQGGCE